MRIAVFSNKFYPNIGGVEVTTRTMAQALIALGHEVTVLASTPLGTAHELDEGYRIVRSIALTTLVSHFRRVDLVVCKGGVSAAAGLAAILARRPLVIVHEMSGSYLHGGGGLKTALSNRIREKACRYARLHIGVSKACLETKGLPEQAKQRVLYNAVDPKLMALAKAPLPDSHGKTEYDIVFVGRVIKSKGIFVFIDAIRQFERMSQSLSAAVIGKGEDLEQSRKMTSGWRHVKMDFTGPLSGTALAAAYRAAKIVAVPSTHPEGMGLVIAEAFAFGRPVIGSDQPAIEEVIGDGGVTFRNGDVTHMYRTIRSLLEDAEFYRHCSQRARRRAGMFSFTSYMEHLEKTLLEVCGTVR